MNVVSISGSPSATSRSTWLLRRAHGLLGDRVDGASWIAVRDLPPAALLAADAGDPAIRHAIGQVEQAQAVLIATPIYQAAYSGLLKAFLDLLPPDALRGKVVLPLATGGSSSHLLAIEYALKPVLSALGARHLLDGVFASEGQLRPAQAGGYIPEPSLLQRLQDALAPLLPAVSTPCAHRERCSA